MRLPIPSIIPFEMRLIISSDASYLSESAARLRAAEFLYLGFNDDPQKSRLNGTVEVISTILTSVTASSAIFTNAKAAASTCATLSGLGYPQSDKPLISDNSTAIGFTNKTTKLKRSKAMDMRYHWIRNPAALVSNSVRWGFRQDQHR